MSPTMTGYAILVVAILAEIFATSCLNASQQFSRLLPSLGSILGYGVAFYCLSVVLKYMPVGIAYAIWCGFGIVLIALIGWVFFKQRLDLPACIGIGLILAGVLVINLFSKSSGH